ncbi:hypothetical protein [Aeromonas hydrophila]|uniref:hypothetical protein n=1 Tax=Aeromonas hydrophila TaxID=644 RepID=UPI002B473F87|nr:hypothetical protein [Aeromonas hydrophila]
MDTNIAWDLFKKAVKEHVVSIDGEQYQAYIEQGRKGVSLYPSMPVYRGYGGRRSRFALVDMAISESGISAEKYFSELLKRKHVVVGHLSSEAFPSGGPVYFFPDMGVYATADNLNVIEVWLSWPAYPKGW